MPKNNQQQVGLIGLGVMGRSLARNFSGKHIRTTVYNREQSVQENFILEYSNDYLTGRASIKELAQSLEAPRHIFLMITAGQPVDDVIDELTPHLSPGDTIIDCGNSHYTDTIRRNRALAQKQLHFVGCGISGGEHGALFGPSLTPGGEREALDSTIPIFQAIAAKDAHGKPCVTAVGPDGAGHFVKMVHNGIEYAIMQLLAETYDLYRSVYRLSPPQIAQIFSGYAKGKLSSYLIDISIPVLEQKDDLTRGFLVDMIADTAGQKGTGLWTVIEALQLGIPVPSILAAVQARQISTHLPLRTTLTNQQTKQKSNTKKIPLVKMKKNVEDALYLAILSAYAQGYHLITEASEAHTWNISLAEISRIWQGGCIIRARVLEVLEQAFRTQSKKTKTAHLFTLPAFAPLLKKGKQPLRHLVAALAASGVSCAGYSASLSYIESCFSTKLSTNYIQGLRDAFGAHTYTRTDRKGTFHTEWNIEHL